jgi:hypothetical protein
MSNLFFKPNKTEQLRTAVGEYATELNRFANQLGQGQDEEYSHNNPTLAG